MKPKLLLLSFLLPIIHSHAQDSSFQLKDYKYRTPGFKVLAVSIGFSGQVSDLTSQGLTHDKNRGFALYPSQLNYARFISTDKRIHTSILSFGTWAQSTYNESNGKATKYNYLNYGFSWDWNDRFYKKNNWFFEVGNSLNNNLGINRQKDTLASRRYYTMEIGDKVTLGLGKGRVERVQDAQMALYILNDLQQQDLLSAPVRPEVARNFAKLITDINNKRVFDYRRKRIYELTQIDSFLRSSGLFTETDIRHFTIINDNWTLAFTPSRLSGSNWFIRVEPSADIEKNSLNTTQASSFTTAERTTKIFTLSPVVGYEKFVPVNLKWQRNMSVSLSWSSGWWHSLSKDNANGTALEDRYDWEGKLTLLNATYGIGFYPNNRTAMNANLGLQAKYITYDNNLAIKSYRQVKPFVNFTTDYFINYKTRLNAYWSLTYEKSFTKPINDKQFEDHYFNSYISLSLSHTLF
jgi:hypothetical protein